jgi:hypothetical protein
LIVLINTSLKKRKNIKELNKGNNSNMYINAMKSITQIELIGQKMKRLKGMLNTKYNYNKI